MLLHVVVHIPTVSYFYAEASAGIPIQTELDAVDLSIGFEWGCPQMLRSRVLAPRYSRSHHSLYGQDVLNLAEVAEFRIFGEFGETKFS